MSHSSLTAQCLYSCNWESSNLYLKKYNYTNFQKHISLMIHCSQKPVKITAFKFSTLSLQSFSAILSTSISYFTLLRSLYNDAKK
ncbi:odorant receptor 13a [Drosophila ananassae]|uniref:odorant receptor 13a n=1 Tax=Drosophila ananassae TaxID=7217 RepID=UPI0013A5C02F|nr:odorant receptor 13a [Drosophila ananassae]